VVHERLVLVVQQLLVVRAADPAREQVVVVRRQADHGKDLAGLRIHHDDDPALEPGRLHPPFHGLQGQLLLAGVDRQPK
jgi:hypothetical protein